LELPKGLTTEKLLRYALQGVFPALLAGVLVFFVTLEEDTLQQLGTLPWSMGAVLLIVVAVAWLCNGFRVFVLCRSLGYPLRYLQGLAISLSTEFGIAATPAGMGGAVIKLSLLRKAGIPLAHGSSMLATDLALDATFFAFLFPFALYSLVRHRKFLTELSQMVGSNTIAAVLSGGLGILLLVAAMRTRAIKKWIGGLFERWAIFRIYRIPARRRLYRLRFKKEIRRALEGLYFLVRLRKRWIALTFLFVALQWTCRYSILSIILYAFSIPHDPVPLFFIQGLLLMGSLAMVIPGGGGGVDLLTALLLTPVVPVYLVGVVVLLWRLFTYHLYLLGGGVAFFLAFSRLHVLFPDSVTKL
jgi:hypothetical protein